VSAAVRRILIAALLLVAGVIWVLVNGPFEGPTLLVLAPDRGLTLADLPSVAAGVGATALLLRGRGRRPPR
jgi:hypothetical protein